MKLYTPEQCLFVTFTVPKFHKGIPVKAFSDPKTAQRLWNSFRTNFLANYIVNGVVVIEPRDPDAKNPGSVHWHAILVFPEKMNKPRRKWLLGKSRHHNRQ